MGITEKIAVLAVALIGSSGYPGIFVLMTMESMVLPVPSEAVMPFAGFLIHDGQFSWIGVIAASSLGSIVGSLISYAIGRYGGKPFIHRFGKFLLLNNHHLEISEKFFSRQGEMTIFISRFIPIVRHLISIPAGFGKMNLVKFTIYTIAGATLWNTFLAYVGYKLKSNWEEVMQYSHIIDLVFLGIIGIAAFYYIYKIVKHLLRPKQSL